MGGIQGSIGFRQVELQCNRAVIRSSDLVQDFRAGDKRLQCLTDKAVIDAPAEVALPRVILEWPARIVSWPLAEDPESINESHGDQPIDPAALIRRDPNLTDRLFWGVVEVFVGVRHIKIAADNHRPSLLT